jgi:hypothetical protein
MMAGIFAPFRWPGHLRRVTVNKEGSYPGTQAATRPAPRAITITRLIWSPGGPEGRGSDHCVGLGRVGRPRRECTDFATDGPGPEGAAQADAAQATETLVMTGCIDKLIAAEAKRRGIQPYAVPVVLALEDREIRAIANALRVRPGPGGLAPSASVGMTPQMRAQAAAEASVTDADVDAEIAGMREAFERMAAEGRWSASVLAEQWATWVGNHGDRKEVRARLVVQRVAQAGRRL